MSILARSAIAFAVALTIALLARCARALSTSGAVAATVVGALAVLAGWKWAILLLVYFASSSVLSRIGVKQKDARTSSVVEKGGERDAMQVLANGGAFALAATLGVVLPAYGARWLALGLGALAASASDTWGTEIGTLHGGRPRSILGFGVVPVGMSGGVTLAGTAAAIAGAAFIALVAAALSWPLRLSIAVFAGGIVGSTLDSLIGATLQQRRWCDRCQKPTERAVHDCGTSTRPVAGLAWLDNDAVNLVSGIAGGLLAMAIIG